MLFGRSRQKKKSRHLRLRVENCVDTILDLNERLGEGKIRPEIIKQFERLKESLKTMTDESVDEGDIDRIEEATNQLLAEIRMSQGEEWSLWPREGPMH
jgi:cell division FtsZ-interacting protein ZapD